MTMNSKQAIVTFIEIILVLIGLFFICSDVPDINVGKMTESEDKI